MVVWSAYQPCPQPYISIDPDTTPCLVSLITVRSFSFLFFSFFELCSDPTFVTFWRRLIMPSTTNCIAPAFCGGFRCTIAASKLSAVRCNPSEFLPDKALHAFEGWPIGKLLTRSRKPPSRKAREFKAEDGMTSTKRRLQPPPQDIKLLA